jgi:molybdopterin-guanine dinucleotide biosynthesis protein A
VNRVEKNSTEVRGYVLAGGASRRFGADKALVEFAGRTLLSRMCELVAAATGSVQVVAVAGRYNNQALSPIEDRWPDEGPLGGIITALRATQESGSGEGWNLMVSCDMPFLTREWLGYLAASASASDADVVVPRSTHGLEPLCACWRTSAMTSLQAAFDEGVRRVTEAMKRLRVEILDETHWKRFDSAERLFWNMNTPQDYQAALQMWETSEREPSR